MKKTAPDFTKSQKAMVARSEANSALCVADLERHARDWVFDGEYRQHSNRTLESRRFLMEKLAWFLSERGYSKCDTAELRQFLAYVANGHKEPCGRWGNPDMTRPVRAITIRDYYTLLRAFCNWLVREGVLDSSPVTVSIRRLSVLIMSNLLNLINNRRYSKRRGALFIHVATRPL